MCCVLIILSVGVTSVRAQDRLMYFIITVGAFSPSTVRGLIHTYTRGFITNSYSRIRYITIFSYTCRRIILRVFSI